MGKNAIVLCSGGLDSVTCAHYARKNLGYGEMIILFFDYGQRTLEQERKCSFRCAEDLGARFLEIKLPRIPEIAGNLVNKKKVQEFEGNLGNTSKESEKWYVPQRNLIFLSYALSIAESLFIKTKNKRDIFTGFKHEGQEHYPDTTAGFVALVNKIGGLSYKGKVRTPLIMKDKEDIVKIGIKLGVNFQKTYSCYLGGNLHCGTCLACKLRQAGFYWANVPDVTEYITRPTKK